MRPVNLIPPEQRRGDRAPMRTGPLAYVVVGVLAAALVGVTLLVMANNQISDREAEKASLESQVAQAEAEARAPGSVRRVRLPPAGPEETVSCLARSRFDWERVLRELAIVIPDDVWLTGLNATVSPDASSVAGASTSSAAGADASIEGPVAPDPGLRGGTRGGREVPRRPRRHRRRHPGLRLEVRPARALRPRRGASGHVRQRVRRRRCSNRDFVSTFEAVAAFDAVQIER